MMEYTISYREICYLVNGSWHTVSDVQNTLMAATSKSSEYLLITLTISKKLVYVIQFQFFHVPFESMAICNRMRTYPNYQPASQTLACTQTCIFRVENVFNAQVHYEQTLSSAIHRTSKVSLLQENVTPCCDLPKQSTFPALLFTTL